MKNVILFFVVLLSMLLEEVECKAMYPYGMDYGDQVLQSKSSFHERTAIKLGGHWMLFSKPHKSFWMSTEGYINLENSFFSPNSPEFWGSYFLPYYIEEKRLMTIYYRETTNASILTNITHDVQSNNSSNNFTPKYAFLATYISTEFEYQVVLATDSEQTYAILNYEKLTKSPDRDIELWEKVCGRKTFAKKEDALGLINGTNTETKGRYVFKISTYGCLHKATGLRFVKSSITISSSRFSYSNYNLVGIKAFSNNEYETEGSVYAVDSGNSVTVVLQKVLQYPTGFNLPAGFYNPNKKTTTLYPNIIVIPKNTKRTKNLQYGSVSVSAVTSEIKCVYVNFTEEMNSMPTVKTILQVGAIGELIIADKFVHAWTEDVLQNGFKVCMYLHVKNSKNIHNIKQVAVKVNYVAVSNISNHVSEISHMTVNSTENTKKCMLVPFKNKYVSPNVFSSVEMLSGELIEPPIVWSKKLKSGEIDVCFNSNSTGQIQFKIHLMVEGKISSCTNVTCPDHLECRIDSASPYCGCISDCKYAPKVCGSYRGKYYSSICELNKEFCAQNGITTRANVQNIGKCSDSKMDKGNIMVLLTCIMVTVLYLMK